MRAGRLVTGEDPQEVLLAACEDAAAFLFDPVEGAKVRASLLRDLLQALEAHTDQWAVQSRWRRGGDSDGSDDNGSAANGRRSGSGEYVSGDAPESERRSRPCEGSRDYKEEERERVDGESAAGADEQETVDSRREGLSTESVVRVLGALAKLALSAPHLWAPLFVGTLQKAEAHTFAEQLLKGAARRLGCGMSEVLVLQLSHLLRQVDRLKGGRRQR
eukprot:4254511-Pyramimonas_sp.AAC.2